MTANHRTLSPTLIPAVIESWRGRRSERERRNSDGTCRGSSGRYAWGRQGDGGALDSEVIASFANATSLESLDSHSHFSVPCSSPGESSPLLPLRSNCSVSGCCFAFSISRHHRKRSAASQRNFWSAAGRRNRVIRSWFGVSGRSKDRLLRGRRQRAREDEREGCGSEEEVTGITGICVESMEERVFSSEVGAVTPMLCQKSQIGANDKTHGTTSTRVQQ